MGKWEALHGDKAVQESGEEKEKSYKEAPSRNGPLWSLFFLKARSYVREVRVAGMEL